MTGDDLVALILIMEDCCISIPVSFHIHIIHV